MSLLTATALAQHAGCAPSSGTESGGDLVTTSGGAADLRPIASLGRLEPKGGVLAIAGTPGLRVGVMNVEEGAHVKKGEILFELDTYPTLVANWRVAEAQVEEAEALLALELSNQELLEREFDLKSKQVRELDPLDIKVQEERVKLLEKAHVRAQEDYGRYERLRNDNSAAVSRQELEAARLQAERAESEMEAARILLEKAERGHKLAEERLGYERQQLGVATKKAQLAARAATAKAQRAAAKAQGEAALVRAPAAGQILRILTHQGESIGNQPVLQLGDTDHIVTIAEVSELDILRLRQAAGSGPVQARITALKDQVQLTGQISTASIRRVFGKNNLLSLNPMVNSDQRVVEVEIELDKESRARAERLALSNLQVDVEIDIRDTAAPVSAETAAVPLAEARPPGRDR
jgi:HlyD family secretion protein